MNNIKALIVQVNDGKDLGDVLQIGRAEAMKLYRDPHKIKVLDVINRPYGWLVVVQNTDGCISESKKMNE
jgi:hypothetical protein